MYFNIILFIIDVIDLDDNDINYNDRYICISNCVCNYIEHIIIVLKIIMYMENFLSNKGDIRSFSHMLYVWLYYTTFYYNLLVIDSDIEIKMIEGTDSIFS